MSFVFMGAHVNSNIQHSLTKINLVYKQCNVFEVWDFLVTIHNCVYTIEKYMESKLKNFVMPEFTGLLRLFIWHINLVAVSILLNVFQYMGSKLCTRALLCSHYVWLLELGYSIKLFQYVWSNGLISKALHVKSSISCFQCSHKTVWWPVLYTKKYKSYGLRKKSAL